MESTWYQGSELRRKEAAHAGTAAATVRAQQRATGEVPALLRPDKDGGSFLPRCASAPHLARPAAEAAGPPPLVTQDVFFERQFKKGPFHKYRAISQAQMFAAKSLHDSDICSFYGAQGAAGFRAYLAAKFGSVLAGWRALDVDCLGRLTFGEFCNACRRMGYHGTMKCLWRELDVHLTGCITLSELDRDAGELLGYFRRRLLEEFGDLLRAWHKGLDVKGLGRIELPEVECCCKKLNFACDPQVLYRMLRSTPSPPPKGVTLEMFDAEAHRKHLSGNYPERPEDPKAATGGAAPPEGLPATPASPGPATREEMHLQDSQKRRKHLVEAALVIGAGDAAGFKRALLKRYGSLLAAWRDVLDLDGNERLGFNEFCLALDRTSFVAGNVKKLWNELDADKKGWLVYGDFDPVGARLIEELYKKLRDKHGNLLVAWCREMALNKRTVITEKDFVAACNRVGFSGDAKLLFQVMKPGPGRTTLSLRDFDLYAYNALIRGDFRMLTEGESKSQKLAKGEYLKMPFLERQQMSFCHEMRAARIAAQKEEFAKTTYVVDEFVIDTPEEFVAQCVRRYGTFMQCWRVCLDYDGNGRLTFNEFCESCRRIGFEGSIKGLWEQYGGAKKGYVAFGDIDPKTDKMINTFLTQLRESYGTLEAAWRRGFKKHLSETITLPELEEACERLKFPYEVDKLWKVLIPYAGHSLLCFENIDPCCTRKRMKAVEVKHLREPLVMTSPPGVTSPGGPAAAKARDTLHRALRNRHGTTVAAWRSLVGDRDLVEISKTHFLHLLQDCEFSGNVKNTLADLVGQEDVESLPFSQIDPDAQGCLDRARAVLLGRFASLTATWSSLCKACLEELEEANKQKAKDGETPLPLKNNFDVWRLDEAAFSSSCKKLGIALKHPERVFRYMIREPKRGQRSLVKSDLRTLLIGLPKDKLGDMWGTEKAEARVIDNLKGHWEKVTKEAAEQDILNSVAGLADIKKQLVIKYGSLFSAWTEVFDQDRNGKVSKPEFMNHLRELGYRVVSNFWAEMDPKTEECSLLRHPGEPEGRGYITFSDLDPKTSRAFKVLEDKLIETYGSVKDGWRQCFVLPKDTNPWVDESKFVRQCLSLHIVASDARRLFKKLLHAPGRRHLIYEELWPSPNRIGAPADLGPPPPPFCPRPQPLQRKSVPALHGAASRLSKPAAVLARALSKEGETSPRDDPAGEHLTPSQQRVLAKVVLRAVYTTAAVPKCLTCVFVGDDDMDDGDFEAVYIDDFLDQRLPTEEDAAAPERDLAGERLAPSQERILAEAVFRSVYTTAAVLEMKCLPGGAPGCQGEDDFDDGDFEADSRSASPAARAASGLGETYQDDDFEESPKAPPRGEDSYESDHCDEELPKAPPRGEDSYESDHCDEEPPKAPPRGEDSYESDHSDEESPKSPLRGGADGCGEDDDGSYSADASEGTPATSGALAAPPAAAPPPQAYQPLAGAYDEDFEDEGEDAVQDDVDGSDESDR